MQIKGGRSKQRPYLDFFRLGYFFGLPCFLALGFLLDFFFAGLARFFALVPFVILRVLP